MSLCALCGSAEARLVVCDKCVLPAVETLGKGGMDNLETRHDRRLVRTLGPVCYLCGEAESEHVEHIEPKVRGGSDHWSNVAAACQFCNLSKGSSVGITPEQAARAGEQQRRVRDAFARIADDERVWVQWLADDASWMVDELVDDPEAFDEDDVLFNLDSDMFYSDYPAAPEGIVERVAEAVLFDTELSAMVRGGRRVKQRTITVGDPDPEEVREALRHLREVVESTREPEPPRRGLLSRLFGSGS